MPRVYIFTVALSALAGMILHDAALRASLDSVQLLILTLIWFTVYVNEKKAVLENLLSPAARRSLGFSMVLLYLMYLAYSLRPLLEGVLD